MSDLDYYLEKSDNLSPLTIRSYSHNYKKILERIDDGKDISETKQSDIIKALERRAREPPSTKRQMLNAVLQIRRSKNAPIDMLLKFRDKLQIKVEKRRNVVNNLKYIDLPSNDDLKLHLKNLYCAEQWRAFIINYIMINLNTRNKDVDLIIVKDRKLANDKTKNYILVRKGDSIVIRNNYKTSNVHGKKENQIKNKQLQNALREFMKEQNPNGDKNRIPLLSSIAEGEQIGSDSLGKYIRQYTFEGISESDINKIQVSMIDSLKDYKKLKQMSQNRGTSVQNLIENYNLSMGKDNENEIEEDEEEEIKTND